MFSAARNAWPMHVTRGYNLVLASAIILFVATRVTPNIVISIATRRSTNTNIGRINHDLDNAEEFTEYSLIF